MYKSITGETLMNNYIQTETNGQLAFSADPSEYISIPSSLEGLHCSTTDTHTSLSGRMVYLVYARLINDGSGCTCVSCGKRMHVNRHMKTIIRHLPVGEALMQVEVERTQYYCPDCGKTMLQEIPCKAKSHQISKALENYTRDLLAYGFTNKEVAELTGLGKNTVKAIDKARLLEKYTVDGKELRKPDHLCSYLAIDEFKLHDGYHYATHIIDLETGHILWIAEGKKKQVVYDFINYIGDEWMSHVVAVACDMNSDFEEAFIEKCPHLQIVYDHFHIVKNFNDKVVSAVRKDEQRRLIEEGNVEAAKDLKKTKYILTSSRDTLLKKEIDAEKERVLSKESSLFNTEEVIRKGGQYYRYQKLVGENRLFFTIDLIKDLLDAAYKSHNTAQMAGYMNTIVELCAGTENSHFIRFSNLLTNHYAGILSHAEHPIASGKIEGINQKIKTVRRQGYGYPDDEYFFLKIIDQSHKEYIRNPKSHKIYD